MSSSIILKSPADWDDFDSVLKALVKARKMENYIFKDGADPPERPALPKLKDFSHKPTGPAAAAGRRTTQATGFASASSATVHQSTPDEDNDEEEGYLAVLTAKGKHAYKQATDLYKVQILEYNTVRADVDAIFNFMRVSVAPHYVRACFTGSSLRSWYINLKKKAGESSSEKFRRITRLYDEHMNIFSSPLNRKTPANQETVKEWVLEWEKIMTTAENAELDFAKSPLQLKNGLPIWAGSFDIRTDEEVEGLVPHEVASTLLSAVMREVPSQRRAPGQRRIGKGAFPSFGNAEYEQDAVSGEESPVYEEEGQPSRKRKQPARVPRPAKKRAPNRRRRRSSATEEEEERCMACEGPHPLNNCFYVFPEKAYPKWFRHEFAAERTRKNLRKKAVKEAIEKIRKEESKEAEPQI
ncbi:hypothetical protein B0T24DRAFT_700977 [Lasiosphaeria ovina]|uniref:Gag protein n=1 Tax=Lasiosphaeria ovina TaxID=92902 RepID=A0AAE0KHM7_9PEZI|nr:hypothetical protein B0T24DRAFT_700977 [Lasiosphaeria ovina]